MGALNAPDRRLRWIARGMALVGLYFLYQFAAFLFTLPSI